MHHSPAYAAQCFVGAFNQFIACLYQYLNSDILAFAGLDQPAGEVEVRLPMEPISIS